MSNDNKEVFDAPADLPLGGPSWHSRHLPLVLSTCILILFGAVLWGSDSTSQGVGGIGSRVKVFAQEFVRLREYESRLRKYESQLRQRSAYFETLLRETAELNSQQTFDAFEPAPNLPKSVSKPLGVGGLEQRGAPYTAEDDRSNFVEHSGTVLQKLDQSISLLKATPIGVPVDGIESSGFGYRASPFSGARRFHSGIDISVEQASAVLATADGIVKVASYQSGYGKTVIIDHGNRIETLYGHLSSIVVSDGQKVCRGQELGLVGNTGNSTGPHLHYEVRKNGVARNPQKFVELARFLPLFEQS